MCSRNPRVIWLFSFAYASEMRDVEVMFALRREFIAIRPELIGLTKSCNGRALIEAALESVAAYLEHRDPALERPAHEAIANLRAALCQPSLW